MKKSVFLFAAAALLLLAGCRHNSGQTTEPQTEPPVSQTENAKPETAGFRSGTWLVSGKDSAAYYFFDADGTSGRTASLEKGIGVGFTCSVQNDGVTFCMGAADAAVKGTLKQVDQRFASRGDKTDP